MPVICVGNVTVGGSGKSPVVAALRKWASDRGIRAASLSRGYKGKQKGPLKVDPDNHSASDVGDEPLMLSRKGESWIGADRMATGKAMAADGVKLIIMDDGFQNPGLHKDHSVLVIDSEAPFGNGHVIPKGPLREPVEHALARAHSVLLMGDGEVPTEISSTSQPVHRARIKPVGPPPDGPLVVFAGIGRPQEVFDALSAHGGNISESVPFPDHHNFSTGDLRFLRKLAEERKATLVTTEKDFARLPRTEQTGITPWPVEAIFKDPQILDELFGPILKALS